MTAAAPAPTARAGGHLDVLDGVRALAAFAVVGTHVGFQTGRAVEGFWAPFLARLDFGVTLFFLLSGFLLYRPFVAAALGEREPTPLSRYVIRRAARILPEVGPLILYGPFRVEGFVLSPDGRTQAPVPRRARGAEYVVAELDGEERCRRLWSPTGRAFGRDVGGGHGRPRQMACS